MSLETIQIQSSQDHHFNCASNEKSITLKSIKTSNKKDDKDIEEREEEEEEEEEEEDSNNNNSNNQIGKFNCFKTQQLEENAYMPFENYTAAHLIETTKRYSTDSVFSQKQDCCYTESVASINTNSNSKRNSFSSENNGDIELIEGIQQIKDSFTKLSSINESFDNQECSSSSDSDTEATSSQLLDQDFHINNDNNYTISNNNNNNNKINIINNDFKIRKVDLVQINRNQSFNNNATLSPRILKRAIPFEEDNQINTIQSSFFLNNNNKNYFQLNFKKVMNYFKLLKPVEKRCNGLDRSKLKRNSIKNIYSNQLNKSCIYALSLPFITAFLILCSTSSIFSEISTNVNSKIVLNREIVDTRSINLNLHLNKLKIRYPKQTSTFWANIESTFRHSVINSKDPSIVIILNEKKTSRLSSNLTADLFKIYLSASRRKSSKGDAYEDSINEKDLSDFIIDPKDNEINSQIINKNSDKVKYLIDEKLQKIFEYGHKLAMVKNIELIPPKAMMLFYTYGDDFAHCKYKGVLILMTLELDDLIEKNKRDSLLRNTSELNSFVESYLRKLWHNVIGHDQLDPLFTRIANNNILVSDESDF